ncbi:MAG: cytochrome c1 [Kiloniellales bacterium]
MKKPAFGALAAALAIVVSLAVLPAMPRGAATAAEQIEIPSRNWSFEGIFGHYDRAAAQRGLQVYREVCSGCHSLEYIAFRNLVDLGYSEGDIRAFAAEATITDGPDDEGEMFEREGRPADYFPSPFPNAQAAAAANNGAAPPDLSLMVKARVGGPNYLYALLTGYEEPPADFELLPGQNYNKVFPGHRIAMAQPLYDDSVTYADGTEATVEQQAHDLTVFLAWTAEPEMEARKRTGIKTILFLLVLTGLLYAVKRKVWSDVH